LDSIASKIEDIHVSYGLNGKVDGTITDNGSNPVKAFSSYSVLSSSESIEVAISEVVEEDEYTFEDINELLQVDDGSSTEDLTQMQYELPPHQRCASCKYRC